MNKKANILQLSIMSLLLLSITSCAPVVYNVKPTDNLNEKKVLAGRLSFYENDTLVDRSRHNFIMFFHKEGDKKTTLLWPDNDGYIYIPVTPGRYRFGSVRWTKPMVAIFTGNLPRFPSVTVTEYDSAVNFGTFNVKYYLTGGEAAGAFFGVSGGRVVVEHVPDYDTTRPAILTKIGTSIPLTDGKVTFVDRVQDDPGAPR